MRWGLGDSPEAQNKGRAISGLRISQGVGAECTSQGEAQLKALAAEKPPGIQRTGTPESLWRGWWQGQRESTVSH